ncbi:MAG: hypothetical protein EBZ50_14975, partial [Alphaproteobacteria bacterium]|nr:hypothetical protein [Alphaproteobacteria bacterium]
LFRIPAESAHRLTIAALANAPRTTLAAPQPLLCQRVAGLEKLIAILERRLDQTLSPLELQIVKASQEAAVNIGRAQDDVAEAIRRGVPNAAAFQAEIERLGSELEAANQGLANARSMDDSDPRRDAAIQAARRRVEAVQAEQANVEKMARDARLGRGFGGERLTNAISAMQGDERFRNEGTYRIANARRRADDEMVARGRLEQAAAREASARLAVNDATAARDAAAPGEEKQQAQAELVKSQADLASATAARGKAAADLEAASKASDLTAAFLEFQVSLEQSLARIRKIGDTGLQMSERGADEAQATLIENPYRSRTVKQRDDAERRLIDDRALIATAQNSLDRARGNAFAFRPELVEIAKEREAIESAIKDREAKAAKGELADKDRPSDADLEREQNR